MTDKINDRSSQVVRTGRDEKIMTTLYALTVAKNEHLALTHFSSEEGVRKRMRTLQQIGLVERAFYRVREDMPAVKLWYLTPRPYKREANNAGRPDEKYPDFPKRMDHHLKTNDIYADIYKPLTRILDEGMIEGSNWLWRNEWHSFLRYEYAGRISVHQPDAEVHFPDGRVFCIERQTSNSRKTYEAFQEKAQGFATYAAYMGFEKGQATLVFACDEKRDQDHAGKACKEHGVRALVTDPTDAANYIVEQSKGTG
jgi:hypothetical protein